MKYEFLYTNGCSHTNHTPEPPFSLGEHEKWPWYLKELMGVEYFNDAVGAGSNDRIFRTSEKFLRNTTINKEKILAVIQITYPYRFEMPSIYHTSGWQSYITDRNVREISNYTEKGQVNYEFYQARLNMLATNEEMEAWYFYQQVSAINNLFRGHNVDCYFINVFHPKHRQYKNNVSGLPECLTEDFEFDNNSIDWLVPGDPRSSDITTLPARLGFYDTKDIVIHPEKDAHFNGKFNKAIAEYIHENIFNKEDS